MFPQKEMAHKEEEFGEQVLTKTVKAGRRTYFFDVRTTRSNDYYLTITESRKTTDSNGMAVYDRHKIFLYKEDFARFGNALHEVVEYIAERRREERSAAKYEE